MIRVSVVLALLLFASLAHASPTYPWQKKSCSAILQGDGKAIGALCSYYDNETQLGKLGVYYFGFLSDASKYRSLYVNLSLNGSGFAQRGLHSTLVGGGNNLPGINVAFGEFTVTTNFDHSFPTGAAYHIFFQGEEIVPTHNPPFAYDNLYGNNYSGTVQALEY